VAQSTSQGRRAFCGLPASGGFSVDLLSRGERVIAKKFQETGFAVKSEAKDPTIGTVVSRECPLCGHHEIGFVTEDGDFHPLRPGTPIQVYEPPSPVERVRDKLEASVSTEKEDQVEHRLWIPEPLRGDRALRLKYSVLMRSHLSQGGMSGGLYELAYVEKLEKLIDKVLDVPLPVILDRLFSAPHLASGNSRQIAEAMYRELDEIQRPVALMRGWLERGDDRSLGALIAPKSMEDLGHEPAEDAQVERELETLTLEEFLEML
jgi:hypothetical protein